MARAGTKRKASTPDAQPDVKQQKHDSPQDEQQTVVKTSFHVPVDEGFASWGGANSTQVFVDMFGTVFDASLNQTNVGKNNNKFYRLQLLHSGPSAYFTHTRWGRVGDFGQVKTMGPFRDVEAALTEFSKKFKDKTGLQWQNRHQDSKSGKYTYIEKDYEQNDDDDESSGHKEEEAVKEDTKAGVREIRSKLPLPTQRLMELIFNQTYQNIVLENLGYNKDKLPLGKLGKPTIKKGFEHLQELAGLLQDSSIAEARHGMTFLEAIEEFTNRYYSTIPHMFGRNRPPIINNQIMLKQEIDMLDTLSDMEIAEHIMQNTDFKIRGSDEINLVDQHFKQLNLEELTPLDAKGKEYQMLKDYLINTSGHTHAINYQLQDVFRVERQGETDRFAKSDFSVLQHSNRRLLWHGSRTTNFGGILQQGLRIAPPEAPASGYAFGKGVYFADISTKSANYCVPSLSGGNGLLLLCEAELGSPMYEITHSDYEAGKAAKKQGCIATMGLGITVPQGSMDAGEIHGSLKGVQIPDISKQPCRQMIHPAAYLQYNEYICYDVAQVRLRYLLRVQMT